MNRFRFLVAMMLMLAGVSSCRSTKKISEAIQKKDTVAITVTMPAKEDTAKLIDELIENIDRKKIEFNTFSAKIKIDYWNNKGKQPDFTANVRIKKDSLIWISIGDLGFEGIRVLITADSIKLLNKLENTYTQRPLSYIQEVSQIPFTFTDIQNLLVGNPVFFNRDSITAYSRFNHGFVLLSVGTLFKNLITISKEYNIEKSKLDDVNPLLNRTCDLTYSEFETKSGFSFPTFREIFISQQTKLDIQMKFKDYKFNEDLNFPFSIPKKFKRIQ
jgi:Domain of unknown function (DUF4292)